MCVASLAIFKLQNYYFTIHCEEEEVLCLISCRRSGVGGGGAWFKERQFWQKYVHKGKKSFWCLATCHSKVGLKSSALHREKKTSQKVSTIFPFWNTSPTSLKNLVFCIEILTSRNVNVDRLTREYFYYTKPTKSNDFFFQFVQFGQL